MMIDDKYEIASYLGCPSEDFTFWLEYRQSFFKSKITAMGPLGVVFLPCPFQPIYAYKNTQV